jgi:hypothetical protein
MNRGYREMGNSMALKGSERERERERPLGRSSIYGRLV